MGTGGVGGTSHSSGTESKWVGHKRRPNMSLALGVRALVDSSIKGLDTPHLTPPFDARGRDPATAAATAPSPEQALEKTHLSSPHRGAILHVPITNPITGSSFGRQQLLGISQATSVIAHLDGPSVPPSTSGTGMEEKLQPRNVSFCCRIYTTLKVEAPGQVRRTHMYCLHNSALEKYTR
jgi:hypothetical protein